MIPHQNLSFFFLPDAGFRLLVAKMYAKAMRSFRRLMKTYLETLQDVEAGLEILKESALKIQIPKHIPQESVVVHLQQLSAKPNSPYGDSE